MNTSRWDMQAFLWSGFLKRSTEYCSLIDSWKHETSMSIEKKMSEKIHNIKKNQEKYIISWINVVFLDGLGDVCLNRKFVLNIVCGFSFKRMWSYSVSSLSLSSIMCAIYELETLCRDYDGTQALTSTPLCHGTRWMSYLDNESEFVWITWDSVTVIWVKWDSGSEFWAEIFCRNCSS